MPARRIEYVLESLQELRRFEPPEVQIRALRQALEALQLHRDSTELRERVRGAVAGRSESEVQRAWQQWLTNASLRG